MCESCWEEEGSPCVDSPEVRAAAKLVAEVYEFAPSGGNLHIMLDDWNLEDDSVEFCRRWLRDHVEGPGEETCLTAFEAMSEKERYSALALHSGFWTTDDQPAV